MACTKRGGMIKSTFLVTSILLLLLVSCDQMQVLPSPEVPSATQATTSPILKTTSPPTVEEIIHLPTWVKNPQVNVLLTTLPKEGNEELGLAFINAETGDQFVLPFENIGAWFWLPDGKRIGMVSPDETEIVELVIASGLVKKHKLYDQARFTVSSPSPNFVTSNDIDSSAFYIVPQYDRPSPDGRFISFFYSDFFAHIFDVENEKFLDLEGADEGYVELYPRTWAPKIDHSYLAIVRAAGVPGYNSYDLADPPNFTLYVYDVESGEEIAGYKDITSANWSPNGDSFLYISYKSNVPCVFYLATEISQCFEKIERFHNSTGNIDLSIAWLSWLPDSKSIAYVYFQSKDSSHLEADGGGFCLFEIFTEEITCMLDNLAADPTKKPVPAYFDLSPDGKHAIIWTGYSGPFSGEGDTEFAAHGLWIANIETGNLIEVKSIDPRSVYWDVLWRPINNQ
jgi:hypothetical protein